jgi:hypothetical protein
MSSPEHAPEPLLRTLAPALRALANSLRLWLGAPHRYPRSTLTNATLEGLANDLRRQGEALDVDRPLLLIVFMGGTGVGKSTLLNALAGGAIAQASFTRPTTRDPVVYYHESVRPEQLDPSLRQCRLVPHNRTALEQKILVDTPDLDSNDLDNREKLQRLLPVADIVLYVGSQEKYHDRLGWDLFRKQRQRRAFAFVLNKWDRCTQSSASGVRPDEDLLGDLRAEGFEDPLLFRTCAQSWADRDGADTPEGLPAGEQFSELVRWVELGLTRREIEAIKARGVSQLLAQVEQTLETACPPDLGEVAARTRASWERLLAAEAGACAEVLLNTLEPHQREIEHHFTVEGHRRFRGLMARYLNFFTSVKYVGNTLRDRIPFLPRPHATVQTPPTWDLNTFTRACSGAAAERQLDARAGALSNRLLVEADQAGFPLQLLAEPVEDTARSDWRQRHAQILVEVMHHVEQQWSRPTGLRRWVQGTIVFLSDWLPSLSFLAACALLLWHYFYQQNIPQLQEFLLPFLVVLTVLVVLHMLIALLLPLRWAAIRGEFQRLLERRLHDALEKSYAAIPAEVAEALRAERRRVEQLRREVREVAGWLRQREQAASIAGLYGTMNAQG